MIYLLDTNACIRYLNGRGIALLERMRRTEASEIAVCSVVRLELFYGASPYTIAGFVCFRLGHPTAIVQADLTSTAQK